MNGARPPSFNPTVHGARGLFASMVFVYHVVHSGLPTFAFVAGSAVEFWLLNAFKFGVELFFGISGYVIVGALARAPSLRSFLWDRATRIYPLLWLTLIAITLASLTTGRWLPPFGQWLLNFAAPPPFFPLAQVNPAAWSLGYELTFYALCGLCWWLRGRGFAGWRAVAVVTGAGLLILFPRAALMPAGMAIAAGLAGHPALRRLTVLPLATLIAFLLCWRWLDLLSGGQDNMTLSPLHMPFAAWLATVPLIAGSALLGALALFGLAAERGGLARLLRTAPFQWLGTISYSFYLWHPVVMGVAKPALKAAGAFDLAGPAAQLLFAAATLPPALVVAHYSQKWIEVRLTRFLRRLGPREGSGRPPLTATVEGVTHAPACAGGLAPSLPSPSLPSSSLSSTPR